MWSRVIVEASLEEVALYRIFFSQVEIREDVLRELPKLSASQPNFQAKRISLRETDLASFSDVWTRFLGVCQNNRKFYR